MTDVNVGNLKHKEAVAFFKNKLLMPSKQWDDLIGPVHAKAFTIAGATKIALLKDMYEAMQRSIESGSTITQFRKDFDKIVAKHGWSYKGKRGWRTSVIFRTNKRTAFMAGKWEQAKRTQKSRPYLQYITVGDERVRASHAIHSRKIYPIDHPFWRTHYPPNGWLCRCTVRTLSSADIEREGLRVSSEPTPKPVERVNDKTGEVRKGYQGIDQGWDYNVGRSYLGPDIALGKAIIDLPTELRATATRQINEPDYSKTVAPFINKVATSLANKTAMNHGEVVTAGYLNMQTLEYLTNKQLLPTGTLIAIRDKDVTHWLRDSKAINAKAIPLSIAASFASILKQPTAILWDTEKRNIVIAHKRIDGRYHKWIIQLNFKSKLNVVSERFKDTLNIVRSAGVVEYANLDEHKYEIIQGELSR